MIPIILYSVARIYPPTRYLIIDPERMMKSFSLHLFPLGKLWELHLSQDDAPLVVFPSYRKARREALRLARMNASRLYIHDSAGQIIEEFAGERAKRIRKTHWV
jgi:hypothetical protein